MPGCDGPLNENQQRRLRITCQHIDHLLSEIENALNEAASKAAFPDYIPDVTPVQQKAVEAYIACVRERLMQTLDSQGIPPVQPGIPLSRSIRTRLYSIDIAAEEIRPRHMRGYGRVSPAAATGLSSFADEMQTLVRDLHDCLTEEEQPQVM